MSIKHQKQDSIQSSMSGHQTTAPRRRAASNYQTLDEQVAERGRKTLVTTDRITDVPRSNSVFDILHAKFGFQEGNVRNQREHFDSWVLNYESRSSSTSSEDAVLQIHAKFFKNYLKWCTFLKTKPYTIDVHTRSVAEKQIALFLLIWGEAGNIRFMPECLCFLYHTMASKLESLERLPNVTEGSFLRRVVRPIYLIVARMRAVPAGGKKALDHKNITNYDDVNEFFWSSTCLDYDELNVADAINVQEHKTFKERRSFLNPLLAFFRIYFFLFVMFHVLTVIAYVAYRSDPELHTGLRFYANFFTPMIKDVRLHAFLSIFMTVSGLLALKVVLEVWIGGARIFTKATYATALFVRLCWHSVFFGLFAVINASPYEPFMGGDKDFLSMGIVWMIIYLVPVVIAALIQTCAGGQLVWGSAWLNGLDGTSEQFIGRSMGQSWSSFLSYGLFWSILYIFKFAFNLQLMIKPLIGPSTEIFDIKVSTKAVENGLIESDHNIAFLVAMWSPVFLVYLYDSQIWLAIMQSMVGACIGIRLKIGHSSRIPEFVDRLKAAPKLFDDQVVSLQARNQLAVDSTHVSSRHSSAPDANSRLRFAVVWNEIVSSFRLSDLLDDRETAILQYQISDSGSVEDPVFLIAGQAQLATDIVARVRSRRLDDLRLQKELEKAGVLGCALNCVDIAFQILRQLLGSEDVGVIQVFEEIMRNGTVSSHLNLLHMPLVRENIVDLLACILDLPEPTATVGTGMDQSFYGIQHDQVMVIVQHVDALLRSIELMLEEEWMAEKMRQSVFAQMTADLSYQKQQLVSIFADRVSHRSSDEDGQHQRATASPSSNESVISLSTRLFFLLTLDATDALPRCHEARRRMSFFLNSLSMRIPSIQSIASMHSFSVITPYYSESVLYSVDELNGRVTSNPLFRKVEVKGRDLSILKYLITFHSDEWGNFLERVGATSIEEALAETPTQVRLWASMRGQTLARTVHGMMMYEDALKMLRWLEIGSDQSISHLDKIKQMDRIAGLKFSYVTSCQLYSQHMASGDSKAADIDLLMRKYPTWRVSYVDTIHSTTLSEPRYDCVLVKSDGDEIVEVYRYELPGNPLVGEGKPENQNIALPFTRGEYVQTIDMNQEHYFEEALKIPNFLATGTENGTNVTILGMKEHIFTGRASSLAHFMTLQELVFVSLTQRVLASPLRSRMHYGHPDVFEKSFVMTNGGVSKASRGINLSEDVFSGYNAALRGEHVTHVEFMQCGKGRDVTLSQINAFEAKLSNGSAESSLSREAHRMGSGMDFFRLHSMFYGHMGFYICNALTVLCVFVYAYAKLYIALHEEIQDAAIVITGGLDDLADVLNTQFIFQFGMLMTIPLMATLLVEYGWRQATANFVELLVTLGPIFYIFETGTKAHFYDVAIMRGGSKYRGTGRGFAIIRETLVNFYKEYAASHYRKAVELMCVMILFGVYGNFSIGTSALEDYCASLGITDRTACNAIDPPQNITLLESYGSKGQDYGVASFAVWVLGASFILAPFLFNTDGLDFAKTRVDIGHWLHWMMAIPGEDEESLPSSQRNGPSDTWLDFYYYESDLVKDMAWTGRVGYMIRELRHPLTMYYVYMTHFKLVDLGLLAGSVGGIALLLWAGSFAGGAVMRNKVHTVRSIAYIIIVIGSIIIVPIVYGSIQSWTVEASVSLVVALFLGLYTVLQYLLLFHGVFGVSVARWGLVVELAFLFDMVVGLFLIFPLLILSAFPFMRTIQTRMMYNVSFSKALSSGSEFAASLSVVVGGLGGWVYGWMNCLVYSLGYVNAPEDSFLNRSFIYFVNEKLDRTFELDTLSVFAALAAALGVIIGTVGAHVFGRRAAIVLSSLVCFGGGALVFVTSSTLILLGCCLVCMGTGMLSISCVLYNYEICMKGWKGKGVLMFLFGASLGYFVEAMVLESLNSKTIRLNWSNVPLHDWQIQFLLGLLPLVILIPVTFFFPETPFWLFRNRDHKSAESTLIRLRQKHDVLDEMDDLKHAFVNKGRKINLWFRVALVIVLQIGFALMMSNALLLRVKVKPSKEVDGEATSKWLIYFGGTNLTGVLLSLMTVDNIRRKTIFKDILPFTAAMSVTCGILDVAKVSNSGFMNVLLYLLFTSASLSLTCATWLTAIEVFPPYQNSRYVALVFVIYYLIQALIYYTKPTFALSHFIFAAICVVLTGVMFAFCASTKAGAIELKGEKKLRQKEEAALADDEEISSYVARVSRSQSFLRSRVRRSSSRYTARTPREGNYENFESPAAHGQTVRRTVNGSRHRQDA